MSVMSADPARTHRAPEDPGRPRRTRRWVLAGLGVLGGGALVRTADINGLGARVPVSPARRVTSAPPTAPSELRTLGLNPGVVLLGWSPSFDDVGVSEYRIERDGVAIGTAAGTAVTFADLACQPGRSHEYLVVAIDADASESPAPQTVTVAVPTAVVVDDFEAGDAAGWNLSGMEVERDAGLAGGPGLMARVDGGAAFAQVELPEPLTHVACQVAVRFERREDQAVTVLKLRSTEDTPIAGVFVSPTGKIGLRNDIAGENVVGEDEVDTGAWYALGLAIDVAVTGGGLSVLLNGRPAARLEGIGGALGEVPVGFAQVGERGDGKRYTMSFDRFVAWSP